MSLKTDQRLAQLEKLVENCPHCPSEQGFVKEREYIHRELEKLRSQIFNLSLMNHMLLDLLQQLDCDTNMPDMLRSRVRSLLERAGR